MSATWQNKRYPAHILPQKQTFAAILWTRSLYGRFGTPKRGFETLMETKTAHGCFEKVGPALVIDPLTEALLQTRHSPISLWNELWAHLSTVLPLLLRDLWVPVSTASNKTTGLGRDCCPWAALWPSPTLFYHGPESVLPAQGLTQGPAWWPSKHVLGNPVEATLPDPW